MSLVEVQPSTVMALNESRTAIRSRSANGPGSTAGIGGEEGQHGGHVRRQHARPLAMPATEKSGASTSTSLRPESVVRMPVAASCAEPGRSRTRAATSAGMPASIGPMGRGMPMRPVEQTSTCSARDAEAGRRPARTCAAASARPRAPVAALALPLLTTTAAARPPLDCQVVAADLDGRGGGQVGGEGGGRGNGRAVVGGHQGQVERPGRLDAGGQSGGDEPLGGGDAHG